MSEAGFALHPRLEQDTYFVTDLPLCRVLLMNEARYPWFILVPRRADVSEIHQLAAADRQQLWRESDQLSHALMKLFTPDKLNLAALGNVVPQLHLHHIARFQEDAAWPAPVWGRFPPQAWFPKQAQAHCRAMREFLQP